MSRQADTKLGITSLQSLSSTQQ